QPPKRNRLAVALLVVGTPTLEAPPLAPIWLASVDTECWEGEQGARPTVVAGAAYRALALLAVRGNGHRRRWSLVGLRCRPHLPVVGHRCAPSSSLPPRLGSTPVRSPVWHPHSTRLLHWPSPSESTSMAVPSLSAPCTIVMPPSLPQGHLPVV